MITPRSGCYPAELVSFANQGCDREKVMESDE